ncbi:MAG: hypothetical protein WAO95_17620 [Burkholderiales bacterium]
MSRASEIIKRERDELKQLLGYWNTVSGSLTAVFSFAPISGAFLDQLLPGPLGKIAPTLGVVLSIIVVLALFYSYRDRNRREIDQAARAALASGLIALCVFVFAWFTWIAEVSGDWHILGLSLTQEARQAVSQGIVPDDVKALLDRFGHNSEDRIWAWRNLVMFAVSLSFAGFFAFVAGSFFLWTLKFIR